MGTENGAQMTYRLLAGVAALTVIAAAAVVAPVMAQVSRQGGPVQWSSDQVHSDQNTNTIFLDGRVEIQQDQARLRADHAQIMQATQGGDVSHIEATGNIYYITTDAQNQQTVIRGDNAVYNKSDDTMVMTGDVVMKQGQSVMSGTRLVSQVSKGITTLDAKTANGPGRAKGVFYPNQAAANSAAPAAH